MSETPRELLVWDEFVASDGYVFGSGVRSATDDEVRAVVVPLLDLEAGAERFYDADDTYPERWDYQAEDVKEWYRRMARIAVYAALGLGEDE